MVTEINKAEVKRVVDILRMELPGSIVIAPDLFKDVEVHACHYCGHIGADVIPGEYYDRELRRDVFNGWACKNTQACLDRESTRLERENGSH